MRRFPEKERNSRSRRLNRLILFAAEGHNKTETIYLKELVHDLGGFTLHKSRDSSTDPIRMVNGLIAAMDEYGLSAEDGDLAFCFIDLDISHDKETQLKKASQLAKRKCIHLIVSNPCFELWFICHFTDSPKHYSSSRELVNDMDRFIASYNKSMEGIYHHLKDRLPTAISNARALEKRAIDRGYELHSCDCSPVTDMFRMMEQLGI